MITTAEYASEVHRPAVCAVNAFMFTQTLRASTLWFGTVLERGFAASGPSSGLWDGSLLDVLTVSQRFGA